jgi:hypothetical protein
LKTPELDFFDRRASDYSGEFTDATRHFFVLEPPHLPEPEPDMNAIRAKLQAGYAAANPIAEGRQDPSKTEQPSRRDAPPPGGVSRNVERRIPQTAVAKFRASMEIDYEKWREGIGYDVELLKSAAPDDRARMEELLVNRPVDDWRDVEALAALGTPRAKALLRKALRSTDPSVSTAVARYAPELMTDAKRTAMLVRALERAETFAGLTPTLLEVAQFHPPKVVRALLRGVLNRDGGTAVHLAAMVMFIHGKAKAPFDWELRPFFLRFHTEDPGERAAACRELCARIGIRAPSVRRTSSRKDRSQNR